MKMIKSNQPTNYNVLILLKRITACILVMTMMTALIPGNFCGSKSAYAAENVQYGQNDTYREIKHEGYETSFSINGTWWSGYNVSAIIRNTTAMTIDNWTVFLQFDGTITNIWDAVIKEHDSSNNTYILTNAGYNEDILPYSTVQFGFTVNAVENSPNRYPLPTECAMLQKEEELQCEEYSVRWTFSDPYNGILFIKNTSDVDICDWSLAFNTDIKLTGFYTAETLSTDGNHISIKNRGYNSDIRQGEEMALGFGCYYVDGSTALKSDLFRNFALTDVRGLVGVSVVTPEHTIIVTPEPTEEPTVTPEPTIIVTPEPTEEPTVTPEPTIIVTPEPTEEPTVTSEPTIIITPEPTEEPTVTHEPTIIVTPEPTEEPTVTPEPTIIVTPEPTEDPTVTPEPTIIVTPEPTEEPTATPEQMTDEEFWYDSDGDGLVDGIEVALGTDRYLEDTDGDGIGDYMELIYDMDPLVFDDEFESVGDYDWDGLSDGDEILIYGTDPLIPDSDYDGLKDGVEINNGFDPLNPDTDGDGILDGDEIHEQEVVLDTDDLGWEYLALKESAGKTGILFGEERDIPDNIGAVRQVSVKMNVSGDISEKLKIDSAYGKEVYPSTVVARVGIPVNVDTDIEFDEAKLMFKYDENLLGDTDENDLRIMWYDEENIEFVIFQDSIVDSEKNTVSCSTTHFSIYMLVDIKEWNEVWTFNSNLAWYSPQVSDQVQADSYNLGNKDILIAVNTGSGLAKNNIDEVKKQLKRIPESMTETDRVGVGMIYGYETDATGEVIGEAVSYNGKNYSESLRYSNINLNHEDTISFVYSFKYQDAQADVKQQLKAMVELYSDENIEYSGKKGVIWFSSDMLPDATTAEIKKLYKQINDIGIKIYQIYTGKEERNIVQERLNQVGGTCCKVTETESIDKCVGNAISLLRNSCEIKGDFDILFLVSSGDEEIKTNGILDEILISLANRIGIMDKTIQIGVAESYLRESDANEEILEPGVTIISGSFHQSASFVLLNESKNIAKNGVDSLTTQDFSAESSYELESIVNFFDDPMNISEREKIAILMTDNKYISPKQNAMLIERNIKLYLLYTGDSILTNTEMAQMRSAAEATGGKLIVIYGNSNAMTDAVSRLLITELQRSDDLDSDEDGIPDCFEIGGMCMPDGNIIYTNPHNKFSDEDSLTDGEEMQINVEKGKGIVLVRKDSYNEIKAVFYRALSNPLLEDSDGDGYWDSERSDVGDEIFAPREADPHPLSSDVDVYSIAHPEYICIDNKDQSATRDHGGYQGWFYDEEVNNDVDSRELKGGGCGVIAISDLLLYLDKFHQTGYTNVDVSEDKISFSEYDLYVREIGKWYCKPRDVEKNVLCLWYLLLRNMRFIRENKISAKQISDLLTNETGTWGVSPDMMVRGGNLYTRSKSFDCYYLDSSFLTNNEKYNDLVSTLQQSMKDDIPVPLLITGTTKYTTFDDIENTTKLHWVNILEIRTDRITNDVIVRCASWGTLIEFSLNEYLTNEFDLKDLNLGEGLIERFTYEYLGICRSFIRYNPS